jgi:hypothetical protein
VGVHKEMGRGEYILTTTVQDVDVGRVSLAPQKSHWHRQARSLNDPAGTLRENMRTYRPKSDGSHVRGRSMSRYKKENQGLLSPGEPPLHLEGRGKDAHGQ